MRVYKLLVTRDGGGSSHIHAKIYDDGDLFMQDLFEVALEYESGPYRGSYDSTMSRLDRMLTRAWHRWVHRNDDDDDHDHRHVVRVRAAQLIDGEWVELDFELKPPKLVIKS